MISILLLLFPPTRGSPAYEHSETCGPTLSYLMTSWTVCTGSQDPVCTLCPSTVESGPLPSPTSVRLDAPLFPSQHTRHTPFLSIYPKDTSDEFSRRAIHTPWVFFHRRPPDRFCLRLTSRSSQSCTKPRPYEQSQRSLGQVPRR